MAQCVWRRSGPKYVFAQPLLYREPRRVPAMTLPVYSALVDSKRQRKHPKKMAFETRAQEKEMEASLSRCRLHV